MARTEQAIEQVLAERPALFVTELAAATGLGGRELDAALQRLGKRLLLVAHCSPDPHLRGDFRVAALRGGHVDAWRPAAERRAADHWSAFVREVARFHRCT